MPGKGATALKTPPTNFGFTSDGNNCSRALDGSLCFSLSLFGHVSENLISKSTTEGSGGTGQTVLLANVLANIAATES